MITREYPDLRLAEVTTRQDLVLFKREMLAWVIGVQVPVYAAMVHLLLRLSL